MDHLLADARHELAHKTRQDVDRETAWKWAARAVAAYQRSQHSTDPLRDAMSWIRDAQDYYHEAIEHAALADHSGEVLRVVREWIHRHVPRGAL
jgi:hypothetical protein